MVELTQQRLPPARLIHALAHVAVEVAIGTLGETEGPVDVEGERRRKVGGGRFAAAAHGRGSRPDASSRPKARDLWVSGCFSSGVISPKVRAWPSGTKMGS